MRERESETMMGFRTSIADTFITPSRVVVHRGVFSQCINGNGQSPPQISGTIQGCKDDVAPFTVLQSTGSINATWGGSRILTIRC